jgi:hypothetical protein
MTARPFQALASAEADPLLRACYEIADLWAQYRLGDVSLGSPEFQRWNDQERAAEQRARAAAEALTPGALNPLRPTIREFNLARDGQPAAMHAALLRRLARRRGPMPGQMALERMAEAPRA